MDKTLTPINSHVKIVYNAYRVKGIRVIFVGINVRGKTFRKVFADLIFVAFMYAMIQNLIIGQAAGGLNGMAMQ